MNDSNYIIKTEILSRNFGLQPSPLQYMTLTKTPAITPHVAFKIIPCRKATTNFSQQENISGNPSRDCIQSFHVDNHSSPILNKNPHKWSANTRQEGFSLSFNCCLPTEGHAWVLPIPVVAPRLPGCGSQRKHMGKSQEERRCPQGRMQRHSGGFLRKPRFWLAVQSR